jgi:hypothetical protein
MPWDAVLSGSRVCNSQIAPSDVAESPYRQRERERERERERGEAARKSLGVFIR